MKRFRIIVLSLLLVSAVTTITAGAQAKDTILRRHSALEYQLQSKPRLPHFPTKMQFGQFFSISQYISYSLPQGVALGVDMCKFVTPLFGLRAGINIGNTSLPGASNSEFYHPRIDCLLDLGAFGWGYNPSRIFTIWGIAGIDGAFLKATPEDNFRFAYGGHLGALLDLRISNTLHLSIEPGAILYSNNYNGVKDWHIADLVGEFHVGLNYRRPVVTEKFYQRLRGSKRNFLTLGAGIQSLPLCGYEDLWSSIAKSISACAMINIGRWFTPLSGGRLSLSYGVSSMHLEEGAKQYASLIGASLDYLYHLSNGENYSNTVSWAIVAGANFSYANLTRRYEPSVPVFNFGFNTGFNLSYNVNPRISLFLEPKTTIYGTAQNSTNTGRVLLNLNTGIAYRW